MKEVALSTLKELSIMLTAVYMVGLIADVILIYGVMSHFNIPLPDAYAGTSKIVVVLKNALGDGALVCTILTTITGVIGSVYNLIRTVISVIKM